MKKALVNYWVDLVTGVAFILCAVTGIVFLFPGAVHTAVGATPTILLIPAVWWHKVHDWTGVAMVAGTALHLALHAKWIANMTRKVFGEPAQAGPGRVGRQGRLALPARAAAAQARADADAGTPTFGSAADAEADAAASLERLEKLRAERDLERQRRISRRRFLAGAATVGGAAVLAGVGLLSRDVASGASTRLRDDGWISSGQGQFGSGSSSADAGGNGGSSSGGTTGSAQSSGSSAGTATTTTTVSVNQSACVACGRCLQVCPKAVFDWSSSGRAEAVNPDACIRCGRCLQVCPAGAITVNA